MQIASTLATSAGVDQAAVSVKLMEGSVKVDTAKVDLTEDSAKVDAEIQAPDANSGEAIEKSINDSKTQLQSRVLGQTKSLYQQFCCESRRLRL